MDIHLETKPDFGICMNRIEAWFNREIIDRAPVRFHRHNAEYDSVISNSGHASLKERWMDAEFQAKSFLDSVKGKKFNAETFPIYMPNLGPNFYAAVHGTELKFGEVTSWCEPIINDESDLSKIKFDKSNQYYKNMHALTDAALEICDGQFLVGYTDLHPGMDCAAAWRGTENLCMDIMVDPDMVKKLMALSTCHFLEVYDDFDRKLKAAGMPSVTWMNFPVEGRLHIPSNDFSFMISPEQFDEFALPTLREEVKTMTHNIFHVDGKGVANQIDSILSVKEVRAIQWVQGMADDYPIMQHIPFIKYLQSRNVAVIVDLDKSDLEAFIQEVHPQGIFLWIAADNQDEEEAIIRRLLKWK